MRDFPYTVKDGDSFSKIATIRYGAEKALFSLASYNKIDPKSTLFTGQKLKLPETIFYNDIDAPSNSVVVRQANVILPEVAEHVAGPATAKIGDKSEFTIDRFKTGATADDKANSGWKIEVFFKDGSKKETIEPEKSKPAFVTSTPAKLVVDKIPGSWANGSFQVFPVVRKADPAVSVKTIVGMKPIELSRSKQRPGLHSRKSGSFTDVADDMVVSDYTSTTYAAINKMCWMDINMPGGLGSLSDTQLFDAMESMCTSMFAQGALESNIKRMISKFKDKGVVRNAGHNTLSDAYSDSVLSSAVLAHHSMKNFVKEAQDQTVAAISGASLDPLAITPFTMRNRIVFHDASDIAGGLTIAINDTWAHDIDLIDYQVLDAKKFKGRIKIKVYDHFGLDEPDLDIAWSKPYGELGGFRAWFILQHLRGFLPFWTVVETESDIEGSLK